MTREKITDHRSQITEEKNLVRGILRGERGAFERFYGGHKQALLQFVQGRVTRGEDAEEIVQDIFLAFLDSLPLFSFRSSLKTFLYSVARHEIADYFRRRYAKRVLKYVPMIGEFVDERLYSANELSWKIESVYKQLLPEYARMLRMKYEEGKSVKQMALKLKMNVKAVESRLFRARKAFQIAYLASST